LFVGCLVSVAQEAILIPYEHEELGLWGYRNPTTEEICIRPIFDEVGEFVGNIAPVKIGKRWGLIDRKGQMVVEPKFDEIGPFFESFFGGSVSKLVALVKDGDDVGFIHENGKMVNEYDDIGSLNEQGLALAKKDGKFGFIDTTGKEIIPPVYDEVESFNEQGLAMVKKDGKSGFIDQTGKEIIPLTLMIDFFNMVEVEKDGKLGLIDATGKEIIPLIYDDIGSFNQQRLAIAKKGGKRGVIDATGKEIIPLIYNGSIELNPLSEKLVRITAQIGEKWSDFVLYVPQPLTTQDLGVR